MSESSPTPSAQPAKSAMDELDPIDRELLNAVQWDFPLEARPFAASKIGSPEGRFIPNMLLAAAKMAVCYAMVIVTALSPVGRRRWLLRGTLHLGVVRALHAAAKPANA